MKFEPLLTAHASTTRPKSEITTGKSFFGQSLFRDQFEYRTWMLLGGFLQCLLFLLPIRTYLACGPVVVLLGWRLVDTALMTFGYTRNVYMDGVIEKKFTALFPSADAQGPPANEQVCVFMLGFKVNHPLGVAAPGFREMARFFEKMIDDLEAQAETHGWLGGSNYIKASERTTKNELMTLHYFRSLEHAHAFAHTPIHREGWDWWNAHYKGMPHLGISHEIYEVPRGKWENIYAGFQPTGFGRTVHAVEDKEGTKTWVSPVVDARRGMLRTSKGRTGVDPTGAGNEKYGEEPYGA